jgi:hypothetical protein
VQRGKINHEAHEGDEEREEINVLFLGLLFC